MVRHETVGRFQPGRLFYRLAYGQAFIATLLFALQFSMSLPADDNSWPLSILSSLNLVAAGCLALFAGFRHDGRRSVKHLLLATGGLFLLIPPLQSMLPDSTVDYQDWATLIGWFLSFILIGLILVRERAPTLVQALFLGGLVLQGSAMTGAFTFNDFLRPDIGVTIADWIYVVGSSLSAICFLLGFQLLAANAVGGPLPDERGATAAIPGKRRSRLSFGDFFTFWKHALPAPLKVRSMVAWYDLLARLDKRGEILFMNHGYAPGPDSDGLGSLPADLEPFRYPIQLYDLVAQKVDWAGKDALEVSSGLGGGTLWLSRTYSPGSLTGLDIAASAVQKCRDRYGALGIRFEAGDAQAMPFRDESFDIVINIESSLNYPDIAAFLREVHRVLRPGGHFLFADYRGPSKMKRLRALLAGMPFEPLMLEDITEGILRGLAKEEDRKRMLIDRMAPRILRKSMARFAGLGSGASSEYSKFASGRKTYLAAVFRKGHG